MKIEFFFFSQSTRLQLGLVNNFALSNKIRMYLKSILIILFSLALVSCALLGLEEEDTTTTDTGGGGSVSTTSILTVKGTTSF
jgi:hypothetical protein